MTRKRGQTRQQRTPSRSWTEYAHTTYRTSYDYLTNDKMLWSPVLIGKQMYQIISRIENPRFFAVHFVGQLTLSLAGNYIAFQLHNNLMERFGVVDNYVFKILGGQEATEADWQSFKTAIIDTASPLAAFLIVKTVNYYVTTSYEIWFKRKLVEHLSDRVWENQGLIALTNSPETSSIVRILNQDIREISTSGIGLLLS